MGATVVRADQSNDTKKIVAAMGQLGKDLGDVETSIAKIRKLQASVVKKPDACADTCKDLYAELGNRIDSVTVFSALPKTTDRDGKGAAELLRQARQRIEDNGRPIVPGLPTLEARLHEGY